MSKASMLAQLAKKKAGASSVDRFAAADAVLAASPGGLPASAELRSDFRAEIDNSSPASSSHPGDFRAEIADAGAVVIEVPIEKVHDNPDNARHVYLAEKVAELADSMRAHGQKVAANAVRHPEKPGEFILIDGHYRKRSLHAAGITVIKLALEEQKDRLQMYLLSRLLNHERNEQTPIDDALSWKKLLDDGVVKDAQTLAETIGISPAKLNKTLSFLKLPSSVLDKVKEHPELVPIFVGYELYLFSKIATVDECLAVLDKVFAGELAARGIEELRLRKEKAGNRKQKELSRQYKIKSENAAGYIKDWDNGKVSLEVTIGDHKLRMEFLDEIKKRFAIE